MPSFQSSSTSSSSSSPAGWSSRFIGLLSLLALTSASINPTYAKLTCSTDLGTYYPYCVNIPDNASGKLPGIMFLSGSGARGEASRVKELSGYDGFGKLINQYYSGNRGEAQKMAAEQFVTIIPISPKNVGGQEIRHWFPENVQKVLEDVKSKHGDKLDTSSLHISGFSMGSRGCWRNGVANPDTWATFSPSAGGAEQSGDGTLSQQKADSVYDKLSAMAGKPVWQFAGAWDSTAGTDSPKRTQDALEKAGDKAAKLSILQADHSALSTQPFNTELMNWMLSHSGGGSSSSSSSSDDVDSKESQSDSDSDSESESSGASKTSSGESSTSTSENSNPKATASGSISRCKVSSSSSKSHKKRSSLNKKKQVKRSLSLSAMLASREGRPSSPAKRSEERQWVGRSFIPGPGPEQKQQETANNASTQQHAARAGIPVDHFTGNNGRSLMPTEFETVMDRRDPAIVARQALKQSAASRVGKRQSR